jgi:hypothetical protein
MVKFVGGPHKLGSDSFKSLKHYLHQLMIQIAFHFPAIRKACYDVPKNLDLNHGVILVDVK